MSEEFKMKVLYSRKERDVLKGFPDYVLLPAEAAEQAERNHGQTLARLNKRGGLGPSELVSVMRHTRRQEYNVFQLVDAFREYHWV